MKKVIVVCITLVAALAFAAAQAHGSVALNNDPRPTLITSGIFLGNEANAMANSANKLAGALSGSITFDFASVTITCEDSTGITIAGAAVNDPCFVGPPTTISGAGTGLHSSFSCYVSAANTVKVRHCAAGTADNPASATFKVRVLQ